MKAKVAIVGAGWYGCHIGMMLDAMGCDVKIIEKNDDVLCEASGNNQFRLHLGFHYARHHRTRVQSREGYSRFLERYPMLSRAVEENYYVVPMYDSIVDFQTYRLIMISTGIEFDEVREGLDYIKNSEGILKVNEQVILVEEAKKHFKEKLGKCLVFNTTVKSVKNVGDGVIVDGEKYDFIIDATWGHLQGLDYQCFYEPTLLLYYRYIGDGVYPAVTMVDGPLCSIYPTENHGIYTLSSVTHTPLGQYETSVEAKNRLKNFADSELNKKISLMEEHVMKYIPGFKNNFEFVAPQYSIKTKLKGEHDDRSCYVKKDGRVISVLSGKIDTIFFGATSIVEYMEKYVHEDISG